MPAPTFSLPATGSDPKATSKGVLDAEVNRVLTELYDSSFAQAIISAVSLGADIYEGPAEGAAATSDGDYFYTPNSTGGVDLWQNSGGAAVFIVTVGDAALAKTFAASIAPYPDRATAEGATPPAVVIRIGLLCPNGDTLWYKDDPTGTALTTADGRNWSPDGEVSAAHWGLPFDAATDCGPAVSAAIAYASAKGITRVVMPADHDTHFVFDTGITAAAGVTLDGQGCTIRKSATFTGNLYDAQGSFNLADSNTLASDSLAGSTKITLSVGKGANMPATGYALLGSTGVFPKGQALNSLGWWVFIIDVTGDVVTIASPLPFDFTTAQSAEIYVPNFLEDVGLCNFNVEGEGATTAGDLFRFVGCLRPAVRNIFAQNISGDNLLWFEGCVDARADTVFDRYHSGVNYTVVEVGPNLGGRFTNLCGEFVRHVYTTIDTRTTASIPAVGCPTGSFISGTAINTWQSCFDTHEDGWQLVFDIVVQGSEASGIQIRAPHTTVYIDAENCRAAAVNCVSDRGDNAVIHVRRAYRTNQGGMGSTLQNFGDAGQDQSVWVNRGAIFIDAEDCYIASYYIEECGGPAIQFFNGVVRCTAEGGVIRNPNQIGTTATAAIDSNGASTGATYVFTGMPQIVSDDGNMDYAFARDDVDAKFIGSYYASGAAIGQFDDGGAGGTLGMERVADTSRNFYDNLLFLNNANGRVGIGTAAPSRPLHVSPGAVNEIARFSSTSGFGFIETADSTGTVTWGAKGGDAVVRITGQDVAQYSVSGLRWLFRNAAGTEYLRLDASAAGFAIPVKPPSYTVATVPSAATAGAGASIFVTNEVGGAVPAFSDGTNWRRVTDRAIVS